MTTTTQDKHTPEQSLWTVEYRPEVGKWEVMQGAAHRGLYNYEDQARAALANLDKTGG